MKCKDKNHIWQNEKTGKKFKMKKHFKDLKINFNNESTFNTRLFTSQSDDSVSGKSRLY